MKKFKTLWIMFFVIILLQFMSSIAIIYALPNWDERNSFGGMYGAINTLFSGLAFCGVIYAIILQGKELELQREELKLTRSELAKAADAQKELTETQMYASIITAQASKLTMYTTLVVNNRTIPNKSHIEMGDALTSTLKDLNELVARCNRN
ncbi:hypothetical protein D3C76_693540 [compost metagenome]